MPLKVNLMHDRPKPCSSVAHIRSQTNWSRPTGTLYFQMQLECFSRRSLTRHRSGGYWLLKKCQGGGRASGSPSYIMHDLAGPAALLPPGRGRAQEASHPAPAEKGAVQESRAPRRCSLHICWKCVGGEFLCKHLFGDSKNGCSKRRTVGRQKHSHLSKRVMR